MLVLHLLQQLAEAFSLLGMKTDSDVLHSRAQKTESSVRAPRKEASAATRQGLVGPVPRCLESDSPETARKCTATRCSQASAAHAATRKVLEKNCGAHSQRGDPGIIGSGTQEGVQHYQAVMIWYCGEMATICRWVPKVSCKPLCVVSSQFLFIKDNWKRALQGHGCCAEHCYFKAVCLD